MAVTRQGDFFQASASFPSSPSNYTIDVGTGSDRVLWVWIGWATTEVTGVTYNGVALTRLANYLFTGGSKGSLWRLIAPATGSHTLAVSHSGVTHAVIAWFDNGVDQTTPEGTIASDVTTFAGVTSATLACDSAVGDLVHRVFTSNAALTGITATGTGSTLRQSGNTADSDGVSAYEDQTAAATTTSGGFSWTTSTNLVIVAFAAKAAAGGPVDKTGTDTAAATDANLGIAVGTPTDAATMTDRNTGIALTGTALADSAFFAEEQVLSRFEFEVFTESILRVEV